MSIIINPNAPPRSQIDIIFDTMRVIAGYRTLFFDLEAAKQSDGVTPEATATELIRIEETQQKLMQEMVTFILYGADKNDGTNKQTPPAFLKDSAQGITKA